MAGQPAIFHALLRPSILQILRATGYHSAKGVVVDSLTDMAARYMLVLCETTAAHAVHNQGSASDFSATDVRLALQDVGALQPEKVPTEQAWSGEEDVRGIDDFVGWFAGPRMKELMDMARGDGDAETGDYLTGLRKKHSKSGEDTKFHGTILRRALDTLADIQVEGGRVASIDAWMDECGGAARAAAAAAAAVAVATSPAPSSGLGSIGNHLGTADADPDTGDGGQDALLGHGRGELPAAAAATDNDGDKDDNDDDNDTGAHDEDEGKRMELVKV